MFTYGCRWCTIDPCHGITSRCQVARCWHPTSCTCKDVSEFLRESPCMWLACLSTSCRHVGGTRQVIAVSVWLTVIRFSICKHRVCLNLPGTLYKSCNSHSLIIKHVLSVSKVSMCMCACMCMCVCMWLWERGKCLSLWYVLCSSVGVTVCSWTCWSMCTTSTHAITKNNTNLK